MKKNLFRYFAYSFVVVTALTLGSCSSDDQYDVEGNPDNLIYFKAGTANSNVFIADVQHTPVGDFSSLDIKIPMFIQHTVNNGTKATVALDDSLVDEYNKKNGTSYPVLPEAAIELLKNSASFMADAYTSADSIEARLVESQLPSLIEPEYMTAFRIIDVNGGGKASVDRGKIFVKINTSTEYIHVNSRDIVEGSIAHTPAGTFGDVSLDLPAYVNQTAKVGATATIAQDNSLVLAYNAEHGTNYSELPEGVLNIENATVSIAVGETTSTTNFKASVAQNKMSQLTELQYMIPLRISAKQASGAVIENAGVIYMIFTTAETLINDNATAIAGSEVNIESMTCVAAENLAPEAFENLASGSTWQFLDRKATASFTVDMSEMKNVTALMTAVDLGSDYEMYLSEDGSNWISVGHNTEHKGPSIKVGWYSYPVYVLYDAVKARYVKFDMKVDTNSYYWNYYGWGYCGVGAMKVYAE